MPIALANVGQGLGGDRAGLLGPGRQRPLDRRLVGPQLRVALADRRQVPDHRLGDRPLEVAVALAVELALQVLRRDPPDDRQDLDQVRDPGLVGAAADLAPPSR